MKVGILTFHDVINAGAFMQAYASVRVLRQLGHSPEIIDYTSPPHRYSPGRHLWQMGWRAAIRPRQWTDAIVTHRCFAHSRKNEFPLSRHFPTRSTISQERYDAVIVGSDIVWDFKLPFLGRDPVYFGEGVNAGRLVTFAASCGTVRPDDVIPNYVREGIGRFTSVSTRDHNTQDMVVRAGYSPPLLVGDPTFLFADSPKMRTQESNEILCYVIPGLCTKAFRDSVIALSRRTGLPIRAIVYRVPWAHQNHLSCTPFEWWQSIANAKYFVTNTFHGTIFGAIQRARFAVEMNDNIQLKIQRMVTEGGLGGRVFTAGNDLEGVLSAKTDWDATTGWMVEQAVIGRHFLEAALA
ncbi:MAG: polysaccharide pyruvyl transferase family protein [Planctomycetota bacterium]